MSGEVSNWSDSSNTLSLIHVGANDGKFHNFVTGRQVIGTTDTDPGLLTTFSVAGVIQVTEDNQLSSNEQNTYFDTLTDFLDFSESNPFGDPS